MDKHIDKTENGTQPRETSLLASREMAILYVKQGSYERGIEMYKRLIERSPDNTTLREQLEDAETLASLLTVRDETQVYDRGFREGYTAARSQVEAASREDRITRLNAWLGRIEAEQ